MIRKSGKPGIPAEGLQPSTLSRDEIPRLRSSARDDIWLRFSARDDNHAVSFEGNCASNFSGPMGHVIPTGAEGSQHE